MLNYNPKVEYILKNITYPIKFSEPTKKKKEISLPPPILLKDPE